MPYLTHRVPVPDGHLEVGEWHPELDEVELLALPTIIALHGMTANHRAWSFLAEAAPRVRIIAPDLRGRGRSGDLPAPFGLDAHVDDLFAVADWFGLDAAIGLGHSLGAFVALLAAQRNPRLFAGMMLVDGGLPLAVPISASAAEHSSAVRGARGSLVFDSRKDYRDFWRAHPGMCGVWSQKHAEYCDYEVVEVDGGFRWAGNAEALAKDAQELYGTARFRSALETISVPTTLIAASRGLFNEEIGIYSQRQLAHARLEYPQVRFLTSDHSHFVSVLSREGAADLAEQLEMLLTTVELCRSGWARNTRDDVSA